VYWALDQKMLSPPKVSPVVDKTIPRWSAFFKNAYYLEFLGLPAGHAEADLHWALLAIAAWEGTIQLERNLPNQDLHDVRYSGD
jgi:hypothetical protein